MPDWEEIDPKLRAYVDERLNPVEMCRKLGWDRKKRQTIVDRLRKLGLYTPAQSKSTQETPMREQTTGIPVEQISLETADTPAEEDTTSVSAVADMSTVTAELVEDLSLVEVQTLERCEAIIAQGIKTFVDVGRALLIIRDQRLYRQAHGTFEEYLRQRWDLSRPYAYQLMDASVVVQNVSGVADISPANEAQSRPLATLPPEQQGEVWKEAVDTAPPSGITAKHVQETVNRAKAGGNGKPDRKPKPKPSPELTDVVAREWYERLVKGCASLSHELSEFRKSGGGITVLVPAMDDYRKRNLLEQVNTLTKNVLPEFARHLETTIVGKAGTVPVQLADIWQALVPIFGRLPDDIAKSAMARMCWAIIAFAQSMGTRTLGDVIVADTRRVEQMIGAYAPQGPSAVPAEPTPDEPAAHEEA